MPDNTNTFNLATANVSELRAEARRLGLASAEQLNTARKGELHRLFSGDPAADVFAPDPAPSIPSPSPSPEAPQPSSPSPSTSTPAPNVAQAVEGLLSALGGQGVNEGVVERIAREVAGEAVEAARLPREVRHVYEDFALKAPPEGRQHYKFPLVLSLIRAGVPAYLVGPAGTGKTTLAANAASALGKGFEAVSFGPMTSKADLFGFVDAGGTYRESPLVKTATAGGVFLGDEIDAAHAGVLTSINMLLANGHVPTPTGLREKSPEFVFLAGANTYGSGASREYVGRNQLDAATLDRFAFVEVDRDEGLEASFLGIEEASPELNLRAGGMLGATDWLNLVRRFRKACEKLKLRHVVSRALPDGGKLLGTLGKQHLAEVFLFKGMDADARAKVSKELGGEV